MQFCKCRVVVLQSLDPFLDSFVISTPSHYEAQSCLNTSCPGSTTKIWATQFFTVTLPNLVGSHQFSNGPAFIPAAINRYHKCVQFLHTAFSCWCICSLGQLHMQLRVKWIGSLRYVCNPFPLQHIIVAMLFLNRNLQYTRQHILSKLKASTKYFDEVKDINKSFGTSASKLKTMKVPRRRICSCWMR
jgi:hypothetical protein